MKLTILGTGPGKSILGQSHTAYLLEDESHKVLLDCGEGTCQKLLARSLVKDEIDFIIISHLHPDHVTGLFILLQTMYLNKRNKDLIVFLPESSESFKDFMEKLYIFNERFSYRVIIQEYDERSFIEMGIYPFKNSHLIGYKELVRKRGASNKLLAYSMLIKGKERSLLLSSDIRGIDDIRDNIDKCEVLILDGIHPSEESIKEIINKKKQVEVYITHGDYQKLHQTFIDQLSQRVRIAEENDEIIL
jgi:ribonuclease BN (tRNA processing enzyme)